MVSHSSVKLPVASYAKRIQRVAEDIARNKLSHLPSVGSDRNPEEVLQVHCNFSLTAQAMPAQIATS